MTHWHKISFVIGTSSTDAPSMTCPDEEWANYLTAREIRENFAMALWCMPLNQTLVEQWSSSARPRRFEDLGGIHLYGPFPDIVGKDPDTSSTAIHFDRHTAIGRLYNALDRKECSGLKRYANTAPSNLNKAHRGSV
jgi:hypothetical protein